MAMACATLAQDGEHLRQAEADARHDQGGVPEIESEEVDERRQDKNERRHFRVMSPIRSSGNAPRSILERRKLFVNRSTVAHGRETIRCEARPRPPWTSITARMLPRRRLVFSIMGESDRGGIGVLASRMALGFTSSSFERSP